MSRIMLRSALVCGLALGAPACGDDAAGPSLVGVWDATSFLVRLNATATEYTDLVTVVIDIEANTYQMRFDGTAVASGGYTVSGSQVTFENVLAANVPMTLMFTVSGTELTLEGATTYAGDQIAINATFDRR